MGKVKDNAVNAGLLNEVLSSDPGLGDSSLGPPHEDWQRSYHVGTGKNHIGDYEIEGDPCTVKAHRRAITEFKNDMHIPSLSNALLELVKLGLQKYKEDKKKSYKDMTPAQKARYIIEQKKTEYQEKWADIDDLYVVLDFETFQVFLSDNDLTLDDFHNNSQHAYQSKETKNSTKIKDWLRRNLQEDQPTKTSVIRMELEKQGLIDDSDTAWANVRKIASRLGVITSKNGCWQWTQEAKIKYYQI